jgi:hypothetical protein
LADEKKKKEAEEHDKWLESEAKKYQAKLFAEDKKKAEQEQKDKSELN